MDFGVRSMEKTKRPWLLIFLPIIIIIGNSVGVFAPISRATLKVMLPVQGVLYRTGSDIKNIFQKEINRRETESEYEKLQGEVARLHKELAHLNELEVEARELGGLLNFQKRTGVKMVVANVVGERTISSARTLLIDRGSDDGILKNLPVVNQDGILVGKIFEVKEKSALILLLLDRRSRVAATIQNKDGTIGIVEGGHGLSSSMKFIPQGEKIEIGNLVVTSGLEETIPRGLLVGTVEGVVKDVREPFQEATIKPLVEFNKLITVAVIKPEL